MSWTTSCINYSKCQQKNAEFESERDFVASQSFFEYLYTIKTWHNGQKQITDVETTKTIKKENKHKQLKQQNI